MNQDIDSAFAELGLTPDATEAEVKAAWRRLVSRWHPDRNASAAAVARMQRLNLAVEAIRQAGFRRGDPDLDEAAQPPAPDRPAAADRPAPEPPTRTIKRKVRLTLEEAAFGCTKRLRGRLTSTCSDCQGAGYRVLGGHCPHCQGSGAVRERSWFGWAATPTECEACHGGGLARQTCSPCAGSGKAPARAYQVTVRFPQGVRHGDLLSVVARPAQPGSPPGDLNIRVEVLPHDLFQLDPDGTLLCAMPVDGFLWLANRTVEVPTLAGVQQLQLNREQLSYRLQGQGFPVERRGPRGDQVVIVSPVFAQHMSTDQQILLDQLVATTSGHGTPPADERLRAWQQALRARARDARGGA
ncbi:DnaJ-class molecular chaperone with C-terminal Zn finger domain [Burkholderiales bacterium JOSHI_001]|nr:DnaJ-class molecular chaperone with C-terminal Zn finger domain [Burkholderiales bacterium JOSHI_001]